MYIASLFNQQRMFQHVGGWIKSLKADQKRGPQELLFRATSAHLSLLRMDFLSKVCLKQFRMQKQDLNIKGNRIAFWSPTLIEFLNEFSPFLSAVRIMQNQIIRLAAKSKSLKEAIPKSLADTVTHMDKYGFDNKLCLLVRDYWSQSGAELKDYRDIDQHYTVLVEQSFLQVHPEEKLVVLLPDNPSEKGSKHFSFSKQRDAFPYFVDAYSRVHHLIDGIAELLGFPAEHLEQPLIFGRGIDVVKGVEQTLGLMILDTLRYTGAEMGQTADQRIGFRQLLPKGNPPDIV